MTLSRNQLSVSGYIMPKKPEARLARGGRAFYSDGVRGAVADIRNGCCEILSAIIEAKTEAALLELRQTASELALELSSIEAAATEKIDKL